MTSGGRFDGESRLGNYWTDTIYPNNFTNGAGKFFTIITEEDSGTTVEYQPPYPSRNRVKLTVTFLRAQGEITEVTLKKFKQYTSRGVGSWEEQSFGPGDPNDGALRRSLPELIAYSSYAEATTLHAPSSNATDRLPCVVVDDKRTDEELAKLTKLVQEGIGAYAEAIGAPRERWPGCDPLLVRPDVACVRVGERTVRYMDRRMLGADGCITSRDLQGVTRIAFARKKGVVGAQQRSRYRRPSVRPRSAIPA